MNADQLRALQTPVKNRYREDPAAARQTLAAEGTLDLDGVACRVSTTAGPVTAGLHPSAGGDGSFACAGDMLLQALVGCAGTTLAAVATALQIPIRGGTIRAEGVMDFRGTLGVSKEIDVGFEEVRLSFTLDTDATPAQLDNLLRLTRRYCVVYQTLVKSPRITESVAVGPVPVEAAAPTAVQSGHPKAVSPLRESYPPRSASPAATPAQAGPSCLMILLYLVLGAVALVIFAFLVCTASFNRGGYR